MSPYNRSRILFGFNSILLTIIIILSRQTHVPLAQPYQFIQPEEVVLSRRKQRTCIIANAQTKNSAHHIIHQFPDLPAAIAIWGESVEDELQNIESGVSLLNGTGLTYAQGKIV
jgi:hypothetical protein